MTRAVLIIDAQMEYFDGALPITHPNGHLENILRVMDAATESHVPVVVIRHHQSEAGATLFVMETEKWQLHPEVEKRHRDLLLEKQMPGSFTGTELSDWLAAHNIDTVTIAGYMTHMCCDTTARQAVHAGLKVEFLSDATGTLDVENSAGKATADELQNSTLVAQQMFLSEVISTDDWLNRI